jgi:hypothetical protein
LIINSEDEPILPLIPNSRFLFYKNMQQHAVGEQQSGGPNRYAESLVSFRFSSEPLAAAGL